MILPIMLLIFVTRQQEARYTFIFPYVLCRFAIHPERLHGFCVNICVQRACVYIETEIKPSQLRPNGISDAPVKHT